MKINKYPDKTSYAIIEHSGGGSITLRVNTYEELHHLEQFVDAYSNKYGQRPLITLPNLIDAQADRRFAEDQSFGLRIVLKRLNSMEADFKIFHPHNPEVVEMYLDSVEIIDNSYFIANVFKDLDRWFSDIEENLILMSSDAGGFKPLMKTCEKLNWGGETFSASKSRKYFDGETHLTQQIGRGDFGGKDILIVDDLSIYGGTFKGLAKMLRERNCGKLYLAVSHMTIQNLGESPITDYFDHVYTTNSKFDNYTSIYNDPITGEGEEEPKNLTVIKMFNI